MELKASHKILVVGLLMALIGFISEMGRFLLMIGIVLFAFGLAFYCDEIIKMRMTCDKIKRRMKYYGKIRKRV